MIASLRRAASPLLLAAALGACGERPPEDVAGAAAADGAASANAAASPAGAAVGTPAAAAPAFDTSRLPEVVARVNGKAIGRRALLDRAEAMRRQMAQMGGGEPPRSEEFYREMTDQLIGAELLFEEAERRGLLASPAEMDAQMARLAAQFPSPEAYREQLAASGSDEASVRADLGKSLAVQRIVTQLGQTEVSEEQARSFYRENAARMKRPAQVQVRHLLVATPREATPEQRQAARQEAEGLRARIAAGEDFATVAAASSDDPGSRQQGGLLPWFGPGAMVPEFERAAFALADGQTSGVVETPFGYHVLRLEGRRAEATVPFEEARAQIEDVLRRRDGREQVRRKVAELRAAAKVEVLF
jgi:peptidyl-prolyl cis-trans isomerase C